MSDKRRKYAAEVSVTPELLDRFPTAIPRIEEELVHKLAEPMVKEAIKGECIVRFSKTEQRQDITTGLIESCKYVYIEEVVRCKDCRYNYGNAEGREYNQNDIVCTYFETDGMDASDFCSHGERRTDEAD